MYLGRTSEAQHKACLAVEGSDYAEHATQITVRAGWRLAQRPNGMFYMALIAITSFAGLGRDVNAQTKTKTALPSFWTGQLEVSVLRCNGECGPYQIDDKGIVSHDSKDLLSDYTYNVYQNDKGTVRHELISANTGGTNEQGRGAQITSYAQGYTLAFDLGASQALRVALVFPNTTATALESREILGFRCNGVRRRWVQQRNQFRNVRETWTAAGIDFKYPLLQVLYGYDTSNRLDLVQVEAVRSIKVSPPLERSLFELPAGIGVFDAGNP